MSREIEIAKKIKAAREEKGLSQVEVVEKIAKKNINMSRETLSKIENGNRTISAIELNALCKILDIDINSIFEDEEDDLITLFRKTNFSENIIKEIEEIEKMIKVFVYQEKIYKGQYKLQSGKEC